MWEILRALSVTAVRVHIHKKIPFAYEMEDVYNQIGCLMSTKDQLLTQIEGLLSEREDLMSQMELVMPQKVNLLDQIEDLLSEKEDLIQQIENLLPANEGTLMQIDCLLLGKQVPDLNLFSTEY